MPATAFTGSDVFDGAVLHRGHALLVEGGAVAAIVPRVPPGAEVVRLEGGILAPGMIDLQV
ncbi:MAG: N-acetylglucosamine-6-phosphate deacetylase, partial [Rhodobacteraceae bacterium]|nr:N-acetylglucosamine-6-phosphate deacetylase [Paracoccaceae bacterium]